jgi:hypothetical protein
MTRIAYIEKNFREDSLRIIAQANTIIREYQAQGFTLTLRQLYYQFVSRDYIANQQKEYDKLGAIVSDGRLAGLIDWEAIEDRGRWLRKQNAWDTPKDIVDACAAQYHRNRWEDQDCRLEVWIEKDALVGVIEPACTELDIPYFACRGYNSQSEQWRAGVRYANHLKAGLKVVQLHLGDHDPSGLDMTRDNEARLRMFIDSHTHHGNNFEVRRLALNWDQVQEYSPPPNPTKLSDSRAQGYVAEYGHESWELDALDPRTIDGIIRSAVEDYIDWDLMKASEAREKQERKQLGTVASRWEEVIDFLA